MNLLGLLWDNNLLSSDMLAGDLWVLRHHAPWALDASIPMRNAMTIRTLNDSNIDVTYTGATLRLRLHTRREGPKESHQMLGVTWSEFPALICRLGEHSKICKPPLINAGPTKDGNQKLTYSQHSNLEQIELARSRRRQAISGEPVSSAP